MKQNIGFIGGAVLIITVIAQAIGTVKFSLGPGMIILFPLVWAIILGSVVSVQRFHAMKERDQRLCARILEIGIMIFIVRLGTLIGPHADALLGLGWALAFQELGHVLGTVILALPVAVGLGLGRASIGAAYSIDREPNLAYVAERFGADSDEYRGALAVYVIGSIFGAIYVALLAGFLGGYGLFDPIALAMGSGVGSGSMMAAASAAIAAEFPAQQSQILAVAAASNLVTEVIGVYAAIFIALPLAERLYRIWQRVFRKHEAIPAADRTTAASSRPKATGDHASAPATELASIAGIALGVGVLMLVSNLITTGQLTGPIIGGMGLMVAITIMAFGIKRWIPAVPIVVWTSLAGIVLTIGHTPVAGWITVLVSPIDFLAMVTPVLAFAGLSIGKDLPTLRRLGPKFFVVAIVVYTATFLAASAIAQVLI